MIEDMQTLDTVDELHRRDMKIRSSRCSPDQFGYSAIHRGVAGIKKHIQLAQGKANLNGTSTLFA